MCSQDKFQELNAERSAYGLNLFECWNFFPSSGKSSRGAQAGHPAFARFRLMLDNAIKDLMEKGIGVNPEQAQPLAPQRQ